MTDFRPGDYRVVAPRRRSIGGWVFLGLALAVLAGGAWVYQFRPQWVARIYDLAGIPRSVMPAQGDKADIAFSALYQRYGMTPLGRGAAGDYKLSSLLASLQKEPCDKQAIFQASLALENMRAIRGAAEMLKGFADVCPDGSGERYRASELYYLLGDYDTAVKLSSDLINHRPDAQNAYFVRAKSEQGLKRYAAAIEDYATLIRLLPDTKSIVSEVFTRMSESYEKLDRPCEAIGPLQTYVALDSESRSTPPLLKRIAALAAKGDCTRVYAKGVARIPRRSNGVSTTKVEINGVEGTFIVDTGASFVTLSRGFAEKAKPRMLSTDSVEIQTANGATSATLASLDSVKLAALSASAVPAIIASRGLGDGVDGLLGMSFLSRFTIVIQDREIQLKAKTLGE
ncbi:MAG: TIGR02281 family clan AA aspartic protease [Xanthobacteraceae bacterium]